MIGPHYWCTGILVRFRSQEDPRMGLSANFQDDGFVGDAHADDTSQGTLSLRYYVTDLARGVDTMLADLGKLGIHVVEPTLYVQGDGEWKTEYYPEDWRATVTRECKRRGWRAVYDRSAS